MTRYPVTVDLERSETMSRPQVFLRILILIVASLVIGSGGWLVLVALGLPLLAAILISQKGGERYLAEDGERVTAWIAFLVSVLAYLAFVTDELPGGDRRPVQLAIVRSGSPSVGSALMRVLKAIPSALVLALLGIVSSVVGVIAVVSILLHERYPARLWSFQLGVIRWEARLLGYLASLVEPYPPFSLGGESADLLPATAA